MISKIDLKNAVAGTNRGVSATKDDKQAIASMIVELEASNPTPDPLSATHLLTGDWRLIYTTSQELLGIDRVPLAQLGEIYQCIRPDLMRIYNIAEINSLPYCESLVSVVASFAPAVNLPADPIAATLVSRRRVDVRFNRGVIGLQRLLGYESPAQYIEAIESTPKLSLLKGIDFSINPTRQQGWLEVTYLDADLRVGRGNQGSLFVLTK